MWIDDAPKVGGFVFQCPLTKRMRVGHWNDAKEYVTQSNVQSKIKQFKNVMPTTILDATYPNNQHQIFEDEYREVTVTEYTPKRYPGLKPENKTRGD